MINLDTIDKMPILKKMAKFSSFDLSTCLRRLASGSVMDFNVYLPTYGKNLQRPYVWSAEKAGRFINALRKRDAVLSPLFIIYYETEKYTVKRYEIIDGRQRLETLINFILNDMTVTLDGHPFKFSDLDSDAQMAIKSYSPPHYYINIDKNGIINMSDNTDDIKITDKQKVDLFIYLYETFETISADHIQGLRNL